MQKIKAKEAHNLGRVFSLGVFCAMILAMTLPQPAFGQGAGKALDFDGNNDYIEIGDLSCTKNPPFTVSAWFKTNEIEYAGIVNKYAAGSFNGFSLDTGTLGLYTWFWRGNSSNYASTSGDWFPYSTGTWYHVVSMIDLTGAYLYVDGKLEKSSTWSETAGSSTETTPLRIGVYPQGKSSATAGYGCVHVTV